MSNPEVNAQIVITAFAAAGPAPVEPTKPTNPTEADLTAYNEAFERYTTKDLVAHDQKVKAIARQIKVATAPESRIMGQLNAIDKAIDPTTTEGKVFVGTVTHVGKEETSKRGLVTLYTGTEQAKDGLPLGYEQLRTDRTDNADGRAIARAAQLLVGHRVTVFVELEAIRGGSTKVRVLRHLESNGVDPNFDFATRLVRTTKAA